MLPSDAPISRTTGAFPAYLAARNRLESGWRPGSVVLKVVPNFSTETLCENDSRVAPERPRARLRGSSDIKGSAERRRGQPARLSLIGILIRV